MENITVEDIVKACGGTLLAGNGRRYLSRIRLDSRQVEAGDLFVPIIGKKVDAHRFIPQVIRQGAGAVLTSRHSSEEVRTIIEELEKEMPDAEPAAWIQVNDAKQALQAVGAFCRSRLSIPVIGITGSVGKTTTREMTAAALGAGLQVFKTPGNSNSQVGVPIAVSEISQADQAAVIELGMSEPGEMTRIAKVALPTMAMITNIGITHIEQLGSRENIFREKMNIQDGLKDGGVLLLNGDDDMLKEAKARDGHGYRTLYYGTGANSDYRAEDIREENGFPVFTAVYQEERVPVRLNVMGRHNVLNAMAALAAAREHGVPMEAAAKSLEAFSGFAGRQQIYRSHGLTVIDDTYNASPVSMKAGLSVLCAMEGQKRRIAVLADMKELGEDTVSFHREVGSFAAGLSVDALITYGELAEEILQGARTEGNKRLQLFHFSSKDQLISFLDHFLEEGDCILFKGSHSMGLGEVAARYGRKKDKD